MDCSSVVEMETAPKPVRGVPPGKDKPQAKRKVAALVGGGGRWAGAGPRVRGLLLCP